jgi:UDP-N-acetylmuramoylalanine--D-glutamate ligase
VNTVRTTLLELRNSSQPVAVIGAGIVGLAVASTLFEWGISVLVLEAKEEEEYLACSPVVDQLKKLTTKGAEVRFGVSSISSKEVQTFGLVVPSPGVPLARGIVKTFLDAKVLLLSEFDLAFGLLDAVTLILITGSNGKSTTTELVGRLLESSGRQVRVCGNIGIPVISTVATFVNKDLRQSEAPEFLVVEGSSYQLEQSRYFVPSVGIFLNLSENHLERHGTMEAYFQAKASPFLRQGPGDRLIVNAGDAWSKELAKMVQSQVSFFGEEPSSLPLAASITYLPTQSEDVITIGSRSFDLSRVHLPGRHNRDNIAVALLAVDPFCLEPSALMKALHTFQGLPHRLEEIESGNGVTWVNDSKATTVKAVEVALPAVLNRYPQSKLLLMLGGQLKQGSDWKPFFALLKSHEERISHLIFFGSGAERLSQDSVAVNLEFEVCSGVEHAVLTASRCASQGEVVLFSPGGASFDEFTSFDKRGEFFREKVQRLGGQ